MPSHSYSFLVEIERCLATSQDASGRYGAAGPVPRVRGGIRMAGSPQRGAPRRRLAAGGPVHARLAPCATGRQVLLPKHSNACSSCGERSAPAAMTSMQASKPWCPEFATRCGAADRLRVAFGRPWPPWIAEAAPQSVARHSGLTTTEGVTFSPAPRCGDERRTHSARRCAVAAGGLHALPGRVRP